MITWVRRAQKLARDRKGQSTAEYVLILAIVVMLVMQFRAKFVSRIGDTTDGVADKIDSIINDLDSF